MILAAAVLVLVAGYLTLHGWASQRGGGLLVIGYCVLFPLGIASVARVSVVTARSLRMSLIRSGRACALGRIAQLVQSACLTRRMSGVRIPLRPFDTRAHDARLYRWSTGPILLGRS